MCDREVGNYKELDEILDNIVFARILRNQNICKLLLNYPETANDFDFNPLDEEKFPDIENTTKQLFMKHVYPLPKMPDVKTEQKCYICVTVAGGYQPEKNLAFRRVSLLFDIICHLDVWRIRDGTRPLRIMHEINKMINNQLTDLPIQNRPYLIGFQPRDYSYYYYGFQLKYDLIVNTDLVCSPLPKNVDFDLSVM